MSSRRLLGRLRTLLLLYVLVLVAVYTILVQARTTDWDSPLWVVVYPINGDASPVTARYIAGLREEVFQPLEEFFRRESQRYGMELDRPIKVKLGPEIHGQPPEPPFGSNFIAIALWSLRMRYWAFRAEFGVHDIPADISAFVIYQDPQLSPRARESLGLRKGMICVVNAFAATAQTSPNNLVIAHELLHTVGASDKYDPATNQPQFPDGYADAYRVPLHPQIRAEIMAGRIAFDDYNAGIPESLAEVVVGEKTAREIRWID